MSGWDCGNSTKWVPAIYMPYLGVQDFAQNIEVPAAISGERPSSVLITFSDTQINTGMLTKHGIISSIVSLRPSRGMGQWCELTPQ